MAGLRREQRPQEVHAAVREGLPGDAAARYEQNEDFFVRMFKEPEIMGQIMQALGGVLYKRLKKTEAGAAVILPIRCTVSSKERFYFWP